MSKRGRRGERNLYQRDGIYWVRIQVAGKEERRSLRTRDRKEALRRLKEEQADAERIRARETPRHRYEDAVVDWAATNYGGVKDGTAARYQVSLRQLDIHFSGKFLDQITRKMIGDYVRKRTAAGATHATVKRDLTALSRLFSAAVALGNADQNPAREWDRSVIKEKREPIERPDARSIEACITAAPFPFNHLIEFLLENGSRLEETVSLQERNVDIAAATATFTKTKATKPRALTLSKPAVAALRKVPRPNYPNPYWFWNPEEGKADRQGRMRGARLTNVSRRFADIKRAAAKLAAAQGWVFRDFRLHDLRHEYAIRWLESGRSIYKLQKHLGHTSVKTTEIYLDFVTADAAAKAKGLAGEDDQPTP